MVISLVSYSLWMGVAELSCRLDLIAMEGITNNIRSYSLIIIEKGASAIRRELIHEGAREKGFPPFLQKLCRNSFSSLLRKASIPKRVDWNWKLVV